MKRFFALASIALALSLAAGASDTPEVIEIPLGSRADLRNDRTKEKVKRCTIETNEGKIFELYPNNEMPQWNESDEDTCGLTVWNVNLNHAGIWTLTTFTDDVKIEKKFALTVSRIVRLKPAIFITADEGQWVRAWFDGNDTQVTECKLRATEVEKEYDLLSSTKPEGMSLYRGCGVRMRATQENYKQWEMRRRIGDYVIEDGIFHIQGFKNDKNSQKDISYHFNLGASGIFRIENRDIIFCQFTRPDGSMTRLLFGSCYLKISVVTKMHQGTWQATFALAGKMKLNQVNIHVETWDLSALNMTQFWGPEGEINLLCRTGVASLNFCTFKRPDEYVINVPVGVGNDNYSYYGDGYYEYDKESRKYGDCGLTIHKPSAVDFGLWACEVGISSDDKIVTRGTVINVVQNRGENSLTIDHPEIFVKRGDRFKIQCTVNSLLDYCWLTSPNGTIYSVLSEDNSESTLEYDGKGFSMGECGAIIQRANISDEGEWICHLGISGSAEIEATIPVQVTDSYLIPAKGKVYENGTAELSCRAFVGEEGSFKYCRWVRPDGNGINHKDEQRYQTAKNIDNCRLFITNIKPVDFGQWTCIAMLTGEITMEQRATIEIESVRSQLGTISVISIVFGTGFLIITLVGTLVAITCVYKRRKFQESIKSPPPYDPENYGVPRVMSDDFNETTTGKDYRY